MKKYTGLFSAPRPAVTMLLIGVFVGITIGGGAGVIASPASKPVTVCVKNGFMLYSKTDKCPVGQTRVTFERNGAAGAKGDTGAAGAKGDTGAAGAKGDTGAAGAKGDTGAAGANGTNGTNGTNGAVITQQSVCDGTDAGTVADEVCKVGMTGPGGGLIFFIDYHDEYATYDYLEVGPSDIGIKNWGTSFLGCGPNSNGNCNSASIYTQGNTNDAALMTARGTHRGLFGGQAATSLIVSKFGSSNKNDYAAGVADDYVSPAFNGSTMNDWWLPSIDELLQMQVLRSKGLGGFDFTDYSSSSEVSSTGYLEFNFVNTIPTDGGKSSASTVRPVRGF
jgi:hypothetical protein